MEIHRFPALTATAAARSRRRVLGAFPVIALALAPLAEARQGRKKRKKKHPCPICPPPPPPLPSPTCAESCASSCTFCFTRPGGAPALCGDGLTVNCSSTCTSDQGCLGTMTPYCASHVVNRTTGEVTDVGKAFGITDPCCISVIDCA